MQVVTLLFLRREGEILLAMKKRGLGQGKWNGVGGKVEPGESIEAAAIRECEEEVGVTPRGLHKMGEIDFYLTHDPSFNHYAHVFVAEQWEDEPHETDEMRPQWFKLADIPYNNMWGDDIHWLPRLLAGERFIAMFTLDAKNAVVRSTLTPLKPKEEFAV